MKNLNQKMLPERKLGAKVISIKIKEYKTISKSTKTIFELKKTEQKSKYQKFRNTKKEKMFLKLLLHIATPSFELRVCFCQKPKLLAEF